MINISDRILPNYSSYSKLHISLAIAVYDAIYGVEIAILDFSSEMFNQIFFKDVIEHINVINSDID